MEGCGTLAQFLGQEGRCQGTGQPWLALNWDVNALGGSPRGNEVKEGPGGPSTAKMMMGMGR